MTIVAGHELPFGDRLPVSVGEIARIRKLLAGRVAAYLKAFLG
jgi:hypothetical protein